MKKIILLLFYSFIFITIDAMNQDQNESTTGQVQPQGVAIRTDLIYTDAIVIVGSREFCAQGHAQSETELRSKIIQEKEKLKRLLALKKEHELLSTKVQQLQSSTQSAHVDQKNGKNGKKNSKPKEKRK